ncbi:MAG: DUF4332 domain-containing protein [Spirochaetes bacterium]|nr:MAG: DUF4332 domain-containing protein [Spirochaetota bacterium]
MPYYIDAEKTNLDDLQKRIEETDLIPSRSSLTVNIEDNFEKLKAQGFLTLWDLRKELKYSKNIPSLSKKTGVDYDYLVLLRREIEGYFPKPLPLCAFDGFQKGEIEKLEKCGLKNSVLLHEALDSAKKRSEISARTGIAGTRIDIFYSLIDLTRIQWISPIAAGMLVAAGYDTIKRVSQADADELYNALDRVNKERNFFKGKIGLRDVKRIVKAASYVK